MSLRERLLTSEDASSLSPQRKNSVPLTPLAQRLAQALLRLADEHDELQLVVRGFVKHMSKNPFDDEEIRSALVNVREHIDVILADDVHTTDTYTHDGVTE
jgi:hypothetical protein